MTDILTVRSLKAGYKKKAIIQDINFSISKGSTVGLIGLNGVGKTTLIKAITGLVRPYAGEVIKKEPHLAYLPENFEPPFFLKGMEYIHFCLKSYKRDSISDEKIEALCDLISLEPAALSRRIKTYSKGMRQKLGVLATYLTGCDLLILDEPMSGLDPKAHVEVKSLLKQAKKEGISLFMSVHNLNDLAELCDSVIFIDQGRVCFQGSVPDMLDQGGDKNIEKAFLNIINHAPARDAA